MKKLIIVPFLLCVLLAFSQEEIPDDDTPKQSPKQFYVGAEAGMNFYSCQTPNYDFIRSYAGQNGAYEYTTLEWYFNQYYFNAIAEFRLANDKIWLSTGIRYSSISAGLGKLSAWGRSDEYFYVNFDNGNDSNSHLYQVDYVQEFSSYIGVPVSMSFSPYKVRFIRLYFKLGVDFNVLLNSNRKVEFYNQGMNYREAEILDLFDDPVDFYSTISPGIGIQLGRQNDPNIRLEANVPAFLISSDKFSFVTPNSERIQYFFIYPLSK